MQAGKTRKVFYQDSGYPIERNLLDLPLERYTVVKKVGILKVFNHVHYKLKGSNPLLNNSHWELFKNSDGIWHFFNGISFGKTPWVVTFETSVPRWQSNNKWLQKKGVQALASKKCKKLIALSQCAKNYQILYLQENFPSYESKINQKITVIHPPQKLLINSMDEKKAPKDKLVFTLIGADFFRKGGGEVLQVFDKLLTKDAPVELVIISGMNYGDYASQTTRDDLKQAQAIINKYPERIHHYKRLPNKDVLALLKKSHAALLPTYGDTYGYSVLEAQACGCPVITSDIRALPEINNDRCGWIIEVPKDRWGDGKLNTSAERSEFSAIVYEKLLDIMGDIILNPEQIKRKGSSCLNRIKENHNPKKAATQLEKIYDEAL